MKIYGLFENKPINKESVILAPSLLNSYSNHHEDGWIVYSNPQSVIGFLKYFYLPTVFHSVFEHESDNYIFVDDLTGFFEHQREKHPNHMNTIYKMEKYYPDVDNLWSESYKTSLDNLLKWTESFNEDWLQMQGVAMTFNVFRSPREVAIYIINVYEEDLEIEMLESDLAISKEQFIALSSDDIYTNEFNRRKFTLTNRLAVTF